MTALASCEHQVCWTHPKTRPAPAHLAKPNPRIPTAPRATLTPAPTPIGCELLKSRPGTQEWGIITGKEARLYDVGSKHAIPRLAWTPKHGRPAAARRSGLKNGAAQPCFSCARLPATAE